MSDTKVPTPEQIAELRAVWSRFVAEQTLSARTRVVDEFIGCRRISALLDAAERCGELERRFANLEMHSCAVAKAADRMRAHEKVQDEMLRAAIARAEAAEKERESLMARIEEVSGVTAAECPLSAEAALAALDKLDRMRPVVEAAVAEYRAADAANDETEPDDTQVQRNGRWAKAETTLHIAVHNYLDGDHAKGGG